MGVESIFARHWWVVALRPSKSFSLQAPDERLRSFAADLAKCASGVLLKNRDTARAGLHIAALEEGKESDNSGSFASASYFYQTDETFFPLAEENLETGSVALADIDECERDFPRRISNGKANVFQYPLLAAASREHPVQDVLVLASPYYLLLRALMEGLRESKSYVACIGVDVAKVFSKLESAEVQNGELTVRSGRMVITGIDYLRSAVFYGENVIRSPLYSNLVGTKGVSVNPKDCRLGRTFVEPVGGNRRPFVCWFDPHGNYRFTPGSERMATAAKFLELLRTLANLKMTRETETFNPLARLSRSTLSG